MNIILDTDSYKPSQWLQQPPGMKYQFSYVESRGSEGDANTYDDPNYPLRMPETVFFGLQIQLKKWEANPVTQDDIEEADAVLTAHGEPFNREGWQYIVDNYGGRLPLKIRAVPEGMVVPTRNVLVTVINTDPKCFWLVSYVETALLRAVWYPTTVATVSWRIKNLISKYMQYTSDSQEGLEFKLHDFGARGVSSRESAGIGGAAHLSTGFLGTDTLEALLVARKYYNAEMPGYSIPASEHSSMTTWGREREPDAYRNMIKQFAPKYPVIAIVGDSWDMENAAREIFGNQLKQDIINSGSTIVVRPDSGDPTHMVLTVLRELGKAFGYTWNKKQYKVLPPYIRVIQGDGIDEKAIGYILEAMKLNKWSTDNVAFGMGGALLQHSNRDTLKFAMKASAAYIGEEWVDVYKEPVSDKGKNSKKGMFTLLRNRESGAFSTASNEVAHPLLVDVMEMVFYNGEVVREYSFDEVRENVNRK